MRYLTLLFSLLLVGCSEQPPISKHAVQFFGGRHTETRDAAIYRAKVPHTWVRQDPVKNDSLMDTKKPICEFYIANEIRVTFHNFPAQDETGRIPPESQIMRWQRQFSQLEPTEMAIIPYAHGGFAGLQFEGKGIMAGKETMVIGWAMQLGSNYLHALTPFDNSHKMNMAADYTIKSVGPPALMANHKKDLEAFALSFELVQELPSP